MEIKTRNKMLQDFIKYDYKVKCWFCNRCLLEIGICECTDEWVRVDDVERILFDKSLDDYQTIQKLINELSQSSPVDNRVDDAVRVEAQQAGRDTLNDMRKDVEDDLEKHGLPRDIKIRG